MDLQYFFELFVGGLTKGSIYALIALGYTMVYGIIKLIKPKMIVTLGRFSMAKLLPGVMISNVHGKSSVINWDERKIVIMPMYHPAAGLRNGEIKRRLLEDFRKIPEVLEEYGTMVEAESGT